MLPDDDDNEPYTRWQGFRIEQLGLCISLFLTVSVAALGFSLSLLTQDHYPISGWVQKGGFLASILIGLISQLCGFAACLTRLADYRTTAKVARHRSNAEMAETVKGWRARYKRLGWWTWALFTIQTLTMATQIIGLTASISLAYWDRLF